MPLAFHINNTSRRWFEKCTKPPAIKTNLNAANACYVSATTDSVKKMTATYRNKLCDRVGYHDSLRSISLVTSLERNGRKMIVAACVC